MAVEGGKLFLRNLIFPEILVNVFAGVFAVAPPPVKYLTVRVVLDGAIPYVLVKIKLEGEYAVLSFCLSNGNPKPTLSGLGTTVSSVSLEVPAPNCNCKDPESINLVANLLCTFFNFNKYGVSPAELKLGSFAFVFFIES